MSEQELRRHRCCFTGHRPERLGMPESEVISSLNKEIRTAVTDGFQTFIAGMARGVDLWAAEIVLTLRDEGAAVRLICASPYQGLENRWSREWQERYRRVMEQSNLVRFICPGYSRDCFQRRNEWMVDHSARVIAVYNGQPIIGEFYLGNITPDATGIRQTSELQKAAQEMADAESFLREHLDGDCLAALERLVEAQINANTTTVQERYVDGFRTGAKFMLDILVGESENLYSLVPIER